MTTPAAIAENVVVVCRPITSNHSLIILSFASTSITAAHSVLSVTEKPLLGATAQLIVPTSQSHMEPLKNLFNKVDIVQRRRRGNTERGDLFDQILSRINS